MKRSIVIKVKTPERFVKIFNRVKQEWYTQITSDCITSFTGKVVGISSVTGFLIGGWYGAKQTPYEDERKGYIVIGSIMGTIGATLLGLLWPFSPIIIGVPYGLYKTVEIATRPTEEELKNQREYRYDPYAV
jgi:hypothetical protein